jgi:hypothetical protein
MARTLVLPSQLLTSIAELLLRLRRMRLLLSDNCILLFSVS